MVYISGAFRFNIFCFEFHIVKILLCDIFYFVYKITKLLDESFICAAYR